MARKPNAATLLPTLPRNGASDRAVDAIEQWPTDRVLPYPANARMHSDEQVAEIAASIAEFGFNAPLAVDRADVLIYGHGRLAAAKKLGLATVPVIRIEHLTEAQARAYRLADNQIAANASWEPALLRTEIADLSGLGLDLGLIGFSVEELRDIVFPLPTRERSTARGVTDGLSFQVIVECEDEDQQAEILEDLRSRGIKCKPLIL